ncbi:hypothetical protein C8R45DRAFT_952828 [Mycena sanguinolenta]|nr:hypothetical protein C8R45DRAFT_952828 [Mycena sanguinolenta]
MMSQTRQPSRTKPMFLRFSAFTSRRFLSSLASRCSSCSHSLPTSLPACSHCGNISPIPASTAFHDIFALPSHPNPFVVDTVLLKRRFREAQAACHPDSWASKGQHKQDIAQSLSSRVNEAYNSLLHPLRRAEYILEQNGLPMSENDKLDDLEFITEIMEARENIEEAADQDELAHIVDENTAKIKETVEMLERTVGEQKWADVKETAVRLKYLEGIEAAGAQKREELVDE